MKYTIIARNDSLSCQYASKITSMLNLECDDINPDIIIAIGGDGTMLRAVKKYFYVIDKAVFFGINTGHLGFYQNWNIDEIDSLISTINKGTFEKEKFNLLEYSVDDGECDYALNDLTVRNNYFVDEFEVRVDGELLEVFRGSGLCVSTTNGSTAFNKSLGGSIIDTDIEAFQLSEMASVNSNAYRTLGSSAVFLGSRVLTIKKTQKGQVMITRDQDVFEEAIGEIKVTLSKKKVYFAVNKSCTFWQRVSKSFI